MTDRDKNFLANFNVIICIVNIILLIFLANTKSKLDKREFDQAIKEAQSIMSNEIK